MRLESNLELATLQARIDYQFKDKSLLMEALTHSTYAYELRQKNAPDNERLEFLGDAVLDLVISDLLFIDETLFDEGYMTKTRALVVCETTLSDAAKSIDLGHFLRLGRGEETTGGRCKSSNLANAVEAIIGAAYRDGGMDVAIKLVLHLLEPQLRQAISGSIVYDYKSQLIEIVQSSHSNSLLCFAIVNEEGPVHERVFTASVLFNEQPIGEGVGSSKKEAEQSAAQAALLKLTYDRRNCWLSEEENNTED